MATCTASGSPTRAARLWLLAIGSSLGLVLAIVGGVLTWRSWGPESALAAPEARRAFGITCGVEFGLAGLGAAVLGITKRPQWIAPWIALVVGVHFVPLAYIFGDPGLLVLATLMVLAVAMSLVVRRRTGVTPSASIGLGSGIALLAFGIRAAVLAATF